MWIVVGDRLPGGRWLAVHLFTLGVLTNVVVVFSQHFGLTVTRAPDQRSRWQPALLNSGILLVLTGVPASATWMIALGATITTTVVFGSYLGLRRMRRQAVGARFAWVARIYERAHGSFIHGAVLGLLLGIGALRGSWYGAGRIAHLHVNVLGWAGLTLLATLVFFGPTMLRTRIEPGADARAAAALRRAATALTIAVVLLLASGIGGAAGIALRVLGAAGLGVYAWGVGVVCAAVWRTARTAKRSAARPALLAVCCWFPLAAWADAIVVATGRLQLLDAVGLAALAGVLGQAVTTAMIYVTPALRGHSNAQRSQLTTRFGRGARMRTLAYNLGVAMIVASSAAPTVLTTVGSRAATAGWMLVIAAVATMLAAALWPLGGRRSDLRT